MCLLNNNNRKLTTTIVYSQSKLLTPVLWEYRTETFGPNLKSVLGVQIMVKDSKIVCYLPCFKYLP